MKSKWFKVIKSETQRLAVEDFEMTELIPFVPGRTAPKELTQYEEEKEGELPHDCSALQQQAFDEGRKAGHEEGTAQCRHEVEQGKQQALMLVETVEAAKAAMLHQMEQDLITLSVAIAKKVIQCEISVNQDVLVHQVRQMMQMLSTKGAIRLKVHPDEVAYLQSQQENLVSQGSEVSIHIEGDSTLGLGACEIETDSLSSNTSIEGQLAILGEALRTENVKSKT